MSILETHTATTIVTNTDQPIDLYNTEISVIMLWFWVIEKAYCGLLRRGMVWPFLDAHFTKNGFTHADS